VERPQSSRTILTKASAPERNRRSDEAEKAKAMPMEQIAYHFNFTKCYRGLQPPCPAI